VTQFNTLIPLLVKGGVRFILVGGAAAVAHGSSRLTNDLDIVYDRSTENIRCIVDVLDSFQPYLRGAPPGLPFRWETKTLATGLNFTLTTSLGNIDLLGEIAGGGTFETLIDESSEIEIFGVSCLCVRLEKLIQLKRAAGRPKDLETIAELELIRDETAKD
jgi:predicted nucleotidyltransferase